MFHEKEKQPIQMKVKILYPYDDIIPEFVRTDMCIADSVRSALEVEAPYWTPRTPIMIDAGTGKGKTSFVYEVLLGRILQQVRVEKEMEKKNKYWRSCEKKNILLISNRVALSVQQKIDIMQKIDHPFKDCKDMNVIRKMEDFGLVRVITYHQLPRFANDEENQAWIGNLKYVVSDEIHCLVADSFFNDRCDYYLHLLTTRFQNAVRIYMTATSWDVIKPLAEAEHKNYKDYLPIISRSYVEPWRFYRYFFPSDYSHVDLHFFDELEEIAEKIEATPSEKWLIFVDSKSKGREFAQSLGDKAAYIDSESKEGPQWEQLLNEHTFSKSVLITTALLDCGLNIIEPALKNLVLITDNRTSMIQMLGRKRCKPGERVNLYVCNLNAQKLAYRRREADEIWDVFIRYDEANDEARIALTRELWRNRDSAVCNYFITTGYRLVPHEIARYALGKRRRFYETLVDPLEDFQKAVRSWLGKSSKEDSKGVEPMEELLDYCDAMNGRKLTEEDLSEFRNLVLRARTSQGLRELQPKRKATIGPDALTNRLDSIGVNYELTPDCVLQKKKD